MGTAERPSRIPSDHSPRLSVADLCVCYNGVGVVRDVRFSVGRGEVFGILGPSGAGKSTILAALTGTVRSTGVIQLDQKDLSGDPPRLRRFGNVYQDFRLFDWMTVYANVAFGCDALGWPETRTRAHVVRILERMRLTALCNRSTQDLSGGQRQRVALARALAFEPRALFLDEPFSDLDPPLRVRLRQDLMRHISETPIPVILVTHDRNEAFELCDRIGVLFDGVLQQVDEPSVLLRAPRTYEIARFLGYTNKVRGRIRASDGHRAVVQIDDEIHHGVVCGESVKEGEDVLAVSRPSSVLASAGDRDEVNVFSVTVGSLHEAENYHFATLTGPNGAEWTAHWVAPPPVSPGNSLTCRVSPEELLLYGLGNGDAEP